MGHSWGFILFLLGLAGCVILCIVWRCWGEGGGQEHRDREVEETHRGAQVAEVPVARTRKKNKKENLIYEKELDQYEAPILKRRSRSKSTKAENENTSKEVTKAPERRKIQNKQMQLSHETNSVFIDQTISSKGVFAERENGGRNNKKPDYNEDPEKDNFYNLIDQKDAKRKLLQKENEERLAKLLDMKHIFTTSTSKTNYRTLDRKINERQAVLKKTNHQPTELPYSNQYKEDEEINSANQGKEKQKHTNLASNPVPPIQVPERRYKRRYSEQTNNYKQDPKISKVINFVAITVNESIPKPVVKAIKEKCKPKSKRIDCPRTIDPPKQQRPVYSVPFKQHQILQSEEGIEEFTEEDIGTIAEYEYELSKADTVIEKKLADEKIDIIIPKVRRLRKEPEPVPPVPSRRMREEDPVRTIKFSSVRSNYVTDSLFAGNIYRGHEEEDGVDDVEDNEADTTDDKVSSWRDRFDKRMSS